MKTEQRAPRWGLGAFVVVEATYLVVAFSLGVVFGSYPSTPVWVAVLAVAVPTLAAAGLAVLITRVRGNGPRIDFKLRWSARDIWIGLAFGIGGLCVSIPAAAIYVALVPDVNSSAGELFGGMRASWPWAVLVFLLAAIVAPFCEEIVYRGLLWGAVDRRWGRWTAFAVTTVVFALAHLEPRRIPLLLVVAIPLGLARLYADGLLASTVAHQVTNLLPAITMMLAIVGEPIS